VCAKETKVRILTAFEGIVSSRSLKTYQQHGGYQSAEQALAMNPQHVVDIIKESGLRGRGGAGFPTGLKWSFVPKSDTGPKYLICNNDEGEPGTFKDRYICELSPHMIIEGMIIAAYSIGSNKGYIYTRCEFHQEIRWLEQAIGEAYKEGFLGKNILNLGFDFDLDHYSGAGAYICGEETGLLSSLEGKKGQPKLKPPFPAVSGYLGQPTIVNNTETLASLPWIIQHGAEAYRSYGTTKSPGTKLFCLSGPVKKPGVYELPLGYSFETFLYEDAGGLLPGKKLKACIPGGLSSPVLLPNELENLKLDYESLISINSMLGSGAIVIIDQEQSIVDILKIIIDFFCHESCGQCTPCREGTGWMAKIMRKITQKCGIIDDVDILFQVASHMGGKTICALSDAAAMPTKAIITKFRDEIESYITKGSL